MLTHKGAPGTARSSPYSTDTLFPYTTLFRSRAKIVYNSQLTYFTFPKGPCPVAWKVPKVQMSQRSTATVYDQWVGDGVVINGLGMGCNNSPPSIATRTLHLPRVPQRQLFCSIETILMMSIIVLTITIIHKPVYLHKTLYKICFVYIRMRCIN